MYPYRGGPRWTTRLSRRRRGRRARGGQPGAARPSGQGGEPSTPPRRSTHLAEVSPVVGRPDVDLDLVAAALAEERHRPAFGAELLGGSVLVAGDPDTQLLAVGDRHGVARHDDGPEPTRGADVKLLLGAEVVFIYSPMVTQFRPAHRRPPGGPKGPRHAGVHTVATPALFELRAVERSETSRMRTASSRMKRARARQSLALPVTEVSREQSENIRGSDRQRAEGVRGRYRPHRGTSVYLNTAAATAAGSDAPLPDAARVPTWN